jgi:hypothetical protein
MSKPETRKFWLFAAFLVLVVCLVSAHSAFGQATTGTISGTVQDVQGGMVPGATVNVRNLDTNISRSLTTGEDGKFRFPGLQVGPYELTVEHTGFARYVRGPIVLLLNQDALVKPSLGGRSRDRDGYRHRRCAVAEHAVSGSRCAI